MIKNDYKEKVLEYLTGNYTEEAPKPNTSIIDYNAEVNSDLDFRLSQLNATLKGIIALNDLRLAFARDYVNQKEYFLVCDDHCNLIQVIEEYESGTPLGDFKNLFIDDENRFYGIEDSDNGRRLVLLNNILAKKDNEEYYVRLRKSYMLPNSIKEADSYIMKKASKEGKYMIISQFNDLTFIATYLKIEVGQTNVWYDMTQSEYAQFLVNDIYASFSEDNVAFTIIGNEVNGSQLRTCAIRGSNASPYMSECFVLGDYKEKMQFKGVVLNFDEMFSIDLCYETGLVDKYTVQFNKHVFAEGIPASEELIDEDVGWYSNNLNVGLEIKNNEIYAIYSTSNLQTYIKVVHYEDRDEDDPIAIGISTPLGAIPKFDACIISNIKDVYNIGILIGSKIELFEDIYNRNTYNGQPYQSLNSLRGNRIRLSQTHDVLLSNTLYNKNIIGNKTIHTLEVPNTLLNGIEINKEELIGETNNVISENQEVFEKNIYEQLFLNIVNYLYINDMNDGLILNNEASKQFNASISDDLDYHNKKITKYKLIYDDNTIEVKSLDSITIEDNIANIEFTIYKTHGLKEISICSNDLNIDYLTINCDDLEDNKIYTINQSIEIGE